MKNIAWYLKQCLPLTYRSKYDAHGKKYFSVWIMWLGRVYKHDRVEIVYPAGQ